MGLTSLVSAEKDAGASGFQAVFSVLKPHLSELDRFLRGQLEAFEPEIRGMAEYCIDTSGKRIRPALVFLSGWSDGAPSSELMRVAAVVELVHLATLVHDDIMDEADIRRNRLTVAREHGAAAAVLLGDALFAHALNLATQFPSTEVCRLVSESTRKVCAGEIIQTLRRGSISVSREDYWRIIDLKTAELFRVSCLLGSRLGGYDPDFVESAAAFGRHLGIAYQIYDDLADFFGDEKRIGKTLGTDLASGKVTLPLLSLLEKLPPSEREKLIAELKNQSPPQPALRIRQMSDLGVFTSVVEVIHEELRQAEARVSTYDHLPPVPWLLRLCGVLRTQVEGLRKTATV